VAGNDENLDNLLGRLRKPRALACDNLRRSVGSLGRLIEDPGGGNTEYTEFLKAAREQASRVLENGVALSKAAVLLPVGALAMLEGRAFPDLDISILGIGNHRYFLFHSAFGLVALRYLYRRWLQSQKDPESLRSRAIGKVAGVALGSFALGVAIHLAADVLEPKSVVFPFFGSLVEGTLVDDRIWLLANSLWAFQIGARTFTLILAPELAAARAYMAQHFASLAGSLHGGNACCSS